MLNSRFFMLIFGAAVLLLALGCGNTSSDTTTTDGGGGGTGTINVEQAENDVWNLVNSERSKAGLSSLSRDSEIDQVAYDHSVAMRDNGYIYHTGPDGTPSSRLDAAGVSYMTCGENVAMGQTSASAVMTAWMNSDGHRANILNPAYTHIGVGLAMPGYYWTQVFVGR